ncbi:hypothetical protein CHS0354_014095 [Potamilus streckersoni]|uniref:Bicarbonate transporter-like transmembrane domain-containing protein n=1 Tax=Potamilus streckersoni TaxID=2493646 RepID=A0AAE0TKQ6_9BIVA|nr:hypothetical protein CHS0354_014095 [Potamilus streckersoni]
MECILAASLTGVIYALLSGQPMNILGNTGPIHVLEGILYRFCKDKEWDFMSFWLLTGLWTAIFITIVVAFDLSCLVKFITRFTEESFASLIALIFIYEAFAKVADIPFIAPVYFYPPGNSSQCTCFMPLLTNTSNGTFTHATAVYQIIVGNNNNTSKREITHNVTVTTPFSHLGVESCKALGGTSMGDVCATANYVPDVFFFSWILFLGMFTLAMSLDKFRNSLFFPTFVSLESILKILIPPPPNISIQLR